MRGVSFFSNKTKSIVLIFPFFILISTYFVFGFLAEVFGDVGGYFGGFLFYWLFWCLLIPILLIGRTQIRSLFKDSKNRFGNPKIVGIIFLAVINPQIRRYLFSINYKNKMKIYYFT